MSDRPDERYVALCARAPSELLAELASLQQENSVLRHALLERSLTPRTRRIVGGAAAILVLALGTAVAALLFERNENMRAVGLGLQDGWASGSPVEAGQVRSPTSGNREPAARRRPHLGP
ncbi:MAG: hypothetical protein ABIY52_06235 [Gemmatimonadaceae bacterium]